MSVSWKLFWSAVGVVVTVALTVALLRVPAPVAVASVVLAVVVFGYTAAWVVAGSWAFVDVPRGALRWIERGLAAAAVAHGGWSVTFLLLPDRWLLLLVVLLGLGAAEYGAACAVEYVLTSQRPRDPVRQQVRHLEQPEQIMHAALDRAGFGWLQIQSWEPVGGDDDERR